MNQIKQANGYRLHSLSPLFSQDIAPAAQPDPDEVDFDLDRALGSVVGLRSEIPEDTFTAPILGTEREGNGVLIDNNGMVLTIGYLIAEAETITLTSQTNRISTAEVIAYDYETGFGMVHADEPLNIEPIALGSSATLGEGDSVIVGGHGGRGQSIAASVVSKREFAGYWEYMLDEAIFTAPPHPNWGGTALIGADGRLAGIGSLFVQDPVPGGQISHGNMFVPIDLLKPIYSDLLSFGRANRPPHPWLGMFTTEIDDNLVIAGTANGGPAQKADVRVGDIVMEIDGEPVETLAQMLRAIWSLGAPGVTVRLTLLREDQTLDVYVRSADRYDMMKLTLRH